MMSYSEFVRFLCSEKKLLDIDFYFAEFAIRSAGGNDGDPGFLLAALVSGAHSVHGHICLRQSDICTPEKLREYLDLPQEKALPVSREWLPDTLPNGILLESGNYFLAGNFRIGEDIRAFIEKRLPAKEQELPSFDANSLTNLNLTDGQKSAAEKSRKNKFLIISGGPGTGKTTILATILALREEEISAIRLCAPTGKAQARMKEALNSELNNLKIPDEKKILLQNIPCSTIHQLLRYQRDNGVFRYNSQRKLPCSLLIVDECSMISQHNMAQLFEALEDDCSVILLGDHAQLNSVQPGNIFGDLCELLADHPGHFAELTESKRFSTDKGIGKLRDALAPEKSSPGNEAWQCLQEQQDELKYFSLPVPEELQLFLRQHLYGWMEQDIPFCQQETIDGAWQSFDSFRLLTPFTVGPYGSETVNSHFISIFQLEKDPVGLPLLQQKNNYELQIFNGDTGMLWYADENRLPLPRSKAPAGCRKLVFFPQPDGSWKGVEQELLSGAVPAFALTVHKAQGSGYDRVLILLPDTENSDGIITRELLYTAVTRAKKEAVVVTGQKTFINAANNKTIRYSGLTAKKLNPAG